MPRIPLAPEHLTLEWLNGVMSAHGRPPAVSFRAQPFGQIGVYGRMSLVELSYRDRPPEKLVAKFALEDAGARRNLAEVGVYAREFRFYTTLAGEMPVRVPRCFFAHFDPETQEILLLMEWIEGEMGDELAGASLDQTRVAVREAGRFHRFWRGNPALARHAWLDSLVEGAFVDGMVSKTAQAAGPAREILEGIAPAWLMDRLPRAGDLIGEQLRALAGPTPTLLHVDYRLPNMLFTGTGAETELALIDWQTVMRGPGVADLAWFLLCSLRTEDRRRWQDDLLDTYLDEVGDLTKGEAIVGLQRYALFAGFNMVRNAPVFDLEIPAHAALLHTLSQRAFAAAEDTGAIDLLT